jgi:hypothetical protein
MRKVMGLLLVCLFVCSSLALADQDLVAPNLRALPGNLSGSVQHSAERTGACTLGLTTGMAYYWETSIGDEFALYLNPTTDTVWTQYGLCTAPIYPYQIDGVEFYTYAYTDDSLLQVGYTYCYDVRIDCPSNNAPGYPEKCAGPGQVLFDQHVCHVVTQEEWNSGLIYHWVPFGTPLCVNGPFFVTIKLFYWDGPEGYAPGPLSAQTPVLPAQRCKIWYKFPGGAPATFCWFNVTEDFVTPWGAWDLWVDGEAGVACQPVACTCLPCPTKPGDNAANPFVIYHANSVRDVSICDYCSDYSQYTELGSGFAETAAGPDVVFKLQYPPEMTTYCFRIALMPMCTEPTFFRIRSWIVDSYGPLYAGYPSGAAAMKNQYYNFTSSTWIHDEPFGDGDTIPALGCYPYGPDVLYLYVDTRNDHCCCPIRVTYEGDQPLPVELASFDVVPGDGQATVSWRTASESNMARYEIYRGNVRVYHVDATNNPSGSSYSFTDHNVVNGTTYTYELRSVDMEGYSMTLAFESVTPTEAPVAAEYALFQNYPNPFNPVTTIRYTLKDAGLVTLKVYSVDGREVATLVHEVQNAAAHNVEFDGSRLASGVYIYTLNVNGFSASHKMVLMK